MALVALVLTVTSAKSIAPPPPDGPPAPIMTGISSSGPAVVNEGLSAQFTCTANYSDGTSGALSPVWSVGSGSATISASGLLSAGNVSADQDAVVTATYGGFTTTLEITIKYVSPSLASIAIAGPPIVNEEATAQYSCTANYSDGSSVVVAANWSESSAHATISGSGLLSADNVSADQNVTVTANFDGKTATKTITVKYIAPSLSGIAISGPAVVTEGTTAQYTCTASYSDGTTDAVTAIWNETSAYATISGSGDMSAADVSSDQSVTITASYGGKSDTHSVTIKYVPPTLEGIAITGSTRVDEESSAQYVCTATYSDGTRRVTPSWSQNSGYASIDASGRLATASVTADQNFTITASYGGKSDTHVVSLVNVVKLVGISISGPASVPENSEALFDCMANYDNGSNVVVSAVWSEDSAVASFGAPGLLVVGNVEVDDSVTITAVFEGKVASRSVAVSAEGTQVSFPLSGFNAIKADLWDETAQAWRELGEMDDPGELVITDVESGQWYWLSIEEYDADSGVWEQVHTNWISM